MLRDMLEAVAELALAMVIGRSKSSGAFRWNCSTTDWPLGM